MIQWILLAVLLCFQSLLAQEILTNGGFENGMSPWSGAGSVSTLRAHMGVHALRFIPGQGMAEQIVTVQSDSTYKLKAWIYIDSSFTGNDWGGILLKVYTYDWSHSYDSEFMTPYDRTVGQWYQETLTFTPASNQIRIQVGMFGGVGWTPNFYIDDVSLRPRSISNDPPVLDSLIVQPTNGIAPLNVSVHSYTHDSDGAIRLIWVDFGDGGTREGANVQYTYSVEGTYTLLINVVDDQGASTTATRTINVTSTFSHWIQITAPTTDSIYTAPTNSISLNGLRQNGSGSVFWINQKTMQSGFVTASNSFSVPNIALDYGANLIQVQSQSASGERRLDEILVTFLPTGYHGPEISNINASASVVGQYEEYSFTFNVNTIATNPWIPFDSSPPAHLNAGDGVTINAVFTNGGLTKIQPAYLDAVTTRMGDLLIPAGAYQWKVRMSIRELGVWQMQIQATDQSGTTTTFGPAVTVLNSNNPSYLKVSSADNRYFEFDNGTPFVGMGYGFSVGNAGETDAEIQTWRENKLNFTRTWLSAKSPFSDPWCSWATHHAMGNNGYMPNPLLTTTERYGNGDVSWVLGAPALTNVRTPSIFRGFWDGTTPALPNRTYRIIARVKTRLSGTNGGLVIKTGGWLDEDDVQPGVGTVISDYARGKNGWSYLIGQLTTSGSQTTLPNLYLTLEAVDSGEAYIDQVTVQEIHADGSLGGNILSKWNANTHYYLDPLRCVDYDYAFTKGAEAQIYFKEVILEKNDWLLNQFDANGFLNPLDGTFDAPRNSKLHRLYEYYWRYLIARWGSTPSIHSWELVNEGAPGSYKDLTDDLCQFMDSNSPYPRMASTSFWSSWAPEYWSSSQADFGDIHAYVMTTGWIDTIRIDGDLYDRNALKEDAAAVVYAYSTTVGNDPQRSKPVILSETDLDMPGDQSPDPRLAMDTAGVWLHDFIWGHINAGGITAFLWNNSNINTYHLQRHYQPFMSFMQGIPLTMGQYSDAQAVCGNSRMRAWGQKQASGSAMHLWIHHKDHNWARVVAGNLPSPISGTVTVNGLLPGSVLVETWSTNDTFPQQIDTLQVSASGVLILNVSNLAWDRAFRVWSLGNIPAAVVDLTINPTTEGALLHWSQIPSANYYRVYRSETYSEAIETMQLIGQTPENSFIDTSALGSSAQRLYYIVTTCR